jgi:hypothetical protein
MTQNYQDIAAMIDADIQDSIPSDAEILKRQSKSVVKIVEAAEAGDKGAPFEPSALAELGNLKNENFPEWMRLRDRLKAAGISITELERKIKGDSESNDERQSTAERLIDLARSTCKFMHDTQREPFAVFESGGARQVYGVLSSGFSDYLSHLYYKEFDRAPSDAAMKVALATLRGQSQFEGEVCHIHTRIAKTDAGYWLDLCNEGWQSVLVTQTGWKVMAGDGTPLFSRSSSMRSLPLPENGGTLDALWPLVNIPSEDRLMVLAWLLECLRPDTPHVVLELIGEQGSVKSTTQKFLRRLIDPNQADLRAAPKSVEDVWVAACKSHMVSLENLSHLSSQFQDALCVLATGGGYSARTMYTNAEETILELRKPIILNGISVIVTAQDLLDRCLHIDLPTIANRELSSDIETRFNSLQPKLLGALLDLFVKVLVMLPQVNIAPDRRPRMADFATLGEAVYRVNGTSDGSFLSYYATKRKDGVHRTLDGSPVGAALMSFLQTTPNGWSGNLVELLGKLEQFRPHGEAWPKSAKGLGDQLRRIAPSLRLIGYQCCSDTKSGGNIKWRIFPIPKVLDQCPASPASPVLSTKGAVGAALQHSISGHAGHSGHGSESSTLEKCYAAPPEDDVEYFR